MQQLLNADGPTSGLAKPHHGCSRAGADGCGCARLLLPGRHDLERVRLEFQRSLQQSGRRRYTPIEVTRGGVIWDGHHAVRAAAEAEAAVDVVVIAADAPPTAASILDLPVR